MDAFEARVICNEGYTLKRDLLEKTNWIVMSGDRYLSKQFLLGQSNALKKRAEESLLVSEVPVDRAARNASTFRDLV